MATIAHWSARVKDDLLGNPIVADVFSSEAIDRCCRSANHRWRASFWSPSITLLTFLFQVLDAGKTLRAGVGLLLTQLAARGQTDLPSCDPSAYCQARRRLPMEVAAALMRQVADGMRDLVSSTQGSSTQGKSTQGSSAQSASAQSALTPGWLGHRVWVVDGSTVSMPDTPALQKAFPQPSGQAAGCGFPAAQVVALFCWTTGAILDVVIDTIRPHELTLFRRCWHHFRPGDVVLGDRAYGSYVDMVRLFQRGVFCVCRLHQRRKADFRQGKRLGRDDQRVSWLKPERWIPSCGIDRDAFDRLPETLVVRLVRITHIPKGFRSQSIVVATTLLDPIDTPADEIRALYRDRWTVELNLRSLKTALGMDVLRGQCPDVVRKEIAMHLLAYNLIRLVMWHAARQHGRDLHRLSFTGTLHRLRFALPTLIFQPDSPHHIQLLRFLLAWIAADTVPDRPNRIEPRRRKRRPKNYSVLTKPRHWYHTHRDPGAR